MKTGMRDGLPLGGSKLQSYSGRLWTKVHLIF